ncbi:MAG: polyphosphate kinase 1 [Bacteroidales bacterium]|nr:polyphosphate kinase 1 [Bacteroidales bacterium]
MELPKHNGNHYVILLEEVIMMHINKLFPGYVLDSWYSIKVTRDADLEYEDYDGEDLIEAIENIETTRAIGAPNRFLYDRTMPKSMLKFLIDAFDIKTHFLLAGGHFHNFRDFFAFPNPLSPKLENEKFNHLRVPGLENRPSILDAIDQKEYMLHFPYQTFDYFIQFLSEAALDENVTEVRTTQYRVASNSAVVEALISAALAGKQVKVFVELKARFDEENNLQYAREMRKAGIQIFYSIPGLKVHSKIALVTRKKPADGAEKHYAFLGTGNFNEKTARLYTDHGFFTADDRITGEVLALYRYLVDQSREPNFKHILVPNFNLIDRLKHLIKQEIDNVRNGGKGYILLKMNGMEDPAMIAELYRASEAGVRIDCIVRGICCLVTGQEYSKNIRVIRIVDKFLEHSREFLFHNNGENIMYCGSADWMRRNLYKRIECVFPVYGKEIKEELLELLHIQLKDNVKAVEIGPDMENIPVNRSAEVKIRTQVHSYNYLRTRYEQPESK